MKNTPIYVWFEGDDASTFKMSTTFPNIAPAKASQFRNRDYTEAMSFADNHAGYMRLSAIHHDGRVVEFIPDLVERANRAKSLQFIRGLRKQQKAKERKQQAAKKAKAEAKVSAIAPEVLQALTAKHQEFLEAARKLNVKWSNIYSSNLVKTNQRRVKLYGVSFPSLKAKNYLKNTVAELGGEIVLSKHTGPMQPPSFAVKFSV